MSYANSIEEINALFNLKNRPYLFRTRLERILIRLEAQAKELNDENVLSLCSELMDKLKCISDKSNQTADGTLKSFIYLKEDLINLNKKIEEANDMR